MKISARQQTLINVAKAKSAYLKGLADAEQQSRTAPITGTVSSYDAETGDWLITTPDGGTLRTRSLTNGTLAGQRLPIQRFGDSQTATVDAPPTESDLSWVLREIEKAQAENLALGTHQQIDTDPNDTDGSGTKHPRRYDRDLLWSTDTESMYRWDSTAEEWVAIGGSPVIYGQGDPNHYEDLEDRIPWQEGAIYYDLINARAFIASPPTDENGDPVEGADKFWMPVGAKTANADEPLTMYYPGDFWQDDQVSSATEEGGMLYRLNENGDWDPQYVCGDCEPDNGTPTMCAGLTYSTTPGSSNLNWFLIYYDCDNPPDGPVFGPSNT